VIAQPRKVSIYVAGAYIHLASAPYSKSDLCLPQVSPQILAQLPESIAFSMLDSLFDIVESSPRSSDVKKPGRFKLF